MTKLIATLAAVSTLGFASAAFAGSPVQLSDAQMDQVTAGKNTAGAAAGGFAIGKNATSVNVAVALAGKNGGLGVGVSYESASGPSAVGGFAAASASSK